MIDKYDIIRQYADKRKGISEEEVEELLDSVLKFINKKADENDVYAIKLPYIGYMYRKFEDTLPPNNYKKEPTTKEKAFISACYNLEVRQFLPYSKTKLEYYYGNKSIEDIMKFQNEDI